MVLKGDDEYRSGLRDGLYAGVSAAYLRTQDPVALSRTAFPARSHR